MMNTRTVALSALLPIITSLLSGQMTFLDSVFATNGTLTSPNTSTLDGFEAERILPLADGRYLGIGSKWMDMGFFIEI